MNIRVDNIPPSCTEEELKRLFSEYGSVDMVRISHNEITDSANTGFIMMEEAEEAEMAISHLNGHQMNGVELKVQRMDDDGLSGDMW